MSDKFKQLKFFIFNPTNSSLHKKALQENPARQIYWWKRVDSNHRSRSNRFTVCPLWPLGNSSIWSWWTDSNPRPADYKSAALPTELHQLEAFVSSNYYIISPHISFVKPNRTFLHFVYICNNLFQADRIHLAPCRIKSASNRKALRDHISAPCSVIGHKAFGKNLCRTS